MSEFVIKKQKPVEIKNEAGEILASYSINVGNHKTLKMWMAKIEEIDKLAGSVGSGNPAIDDLVRIERELIEMITGDWENLWSICEENVFTMLQVVRFFSSHVREEIEKFTGQYL